MPQTIALQARAAQINPAKILGDSYRLEDMRNQSSLNRLKLDDYQQTRGTAVESTIAKHRESMSDSDRGIYENTIINLGDRADQILALPPGQQVEPWNALLEEVKDKLPAGQYDLYHNNPNPLMLQQASDAGASLRRGSKAGTTGRTVGQSDANNRFAMEQANKRHNGRYPRVDKIGMEIEYSPEQIAQQKKEWQADFEHYRSQLQGNAASAGQAQTGGIGNDPSLPSPEISGSSSGNAGDQAGAGDSVPFTLALEHDFTGMDRDEFIEKKKKLDHR